jgi:hypothetical protein
MTNKSDMKLPIDDFRFPICGSETPVAAAQAAATENMS